jgi:hypothetical protein
VRLIVIHSPSFEAIMIGYLTLHYCLERLFNVELDDMFLGMAYGKEVVITWKD